jgi:site-specific DNA-methyltransferase (adenine-specific)
MLLHSMSIQLHQGDCLNVLKAFPDEKVDLIYLDPPFFTQKIQSLRTRDRQKVFKFSDVWRSFDDYGEFLFDRLKEMRRVLAPTGSIFFHCDSNGSTISRLILDDLFGRNMFRAEIIWHYRRWSNSQRTLLPSHQNIYFYSKTDNYKFNKILHDYSSSTNVDQILQKRKRDQFGKSVYARDEKGTPLPNGDKKGVPLNDVWDIPFLNPKAKERVGYPTQKPILLLERIIRLTTDEANSVLDPFCGSGTTIVAAKLLGRHAIGIDSSAEAIELAKRRLKDPTRTDSPLLQAGRESYRTADEQALSILSGLDIIPVQRNKGIDAFVSAGLDAPVPIRVQRIHESIIEAASALRKASESKRVSAKILIAMNADFDLDISAAFPDIIIIDSPAKNIRKVLRSIEATQTKPISTAASQC